MKWALLTAISLHLVLFVVLLLQLNSSTSPSEVGNYLTAYVKLSPDPIGKANTTNTVHNTLEPVVNSSFSNPKTHVINSSTQTPRYGQENKLLLYLHNAVQNQINANQLAQLSFIQVTPLTICFTIWHNGAITNIKILQASNSQLLNNLAIKTINSLQPVTMASQFIGDNGNYCVKINK